MLSDRLPHRIAPLVFTAAAVVLTMFTAAISAAPPAHLLDDEIGSLPGQFSVQGGAATYAIPIEVVPGTAGVQPKLAFNYSSQGQVTHMGPGWTLSGLSVITRCGRTLALDGSTIGIEWKSTDRYCLDGQRLMLVSGTYGAAGSEYRTEVDAFNQITAQGQQGEGPKYFKAQTKSGQTLIYGNTGNSRIEANGRTEVFAWGLNKLTDASGNYLKVTYSEKTSHTEFYPTKVRYTGNDAAGVTPYADVQFVYSTLDEDEKSTHYISGVKFRRTRRLDRVETYKGTTKVSEYKLTYKERADEPDLLEEMQYCDGEGSQGCVSPIQFVWQEGEVPSTAFDTESVWINSGFPISHNPHAYIPHDTAVTPHTADVDGDGLRDVYAISNIGSENTAHTLKVYRSEGHDLSLYYNETCSGCNFGLADVDGDGKDDLVRSSTTGAVEVALSTGSGFGNYTTWIASGFPTDLDYGEYVSVPIAECPSYVIGGRVGVVDNNGDQLDDVFSIAGKGTTGNITLQIYESDGQDFNLVHSESCSDCNYGVADVDGDGWADKIRTIPTGGIAEVALGSATGYSDYTVWSDWGFGGQQWETTCPDHPNSYIQKTRRVGAPVYNTDFDGDSLPDIYIPNLYVFRSDGSEFELTYAATCSGTGDCAFGLGDFNGDGRPDLVRTTRTGQAKVSLANHGTPDLLTKIKDSLRSKITINYSDLTDTALHTPANPVQTYPLRNVRGPIPLVESVEREDGIGGETITSYQYGEAIAEVTGRGFLGFAWDAASAVMTDGATGVDYTITTHTTYSQDYPFVGMPTLVETTMQESGTNPPPAVTLSRVTSTYDEITTDYDETRPDSSVHTYTTHFPYLDVKTEASYETDGSTVRTVTTTQSNYDAYGNVGEVKVETTSASGSTYTKTTTNTYSNDTSKWHLGRLTAATVIHEKPNATTMTRASSFTYNTDGLLEKEIIEPGTTLEQVTEYVYDAFGNKVSVTVSGEEDIGGQLQTVSRTTTTDYDTTGGHINGRFPVRVTNALGHTETRTFDPNHGKTKTLTGPNGLVTQWTYDSFGRKTLETRADGTTTTITRGWVDTNDDDAPSAAYYWVTEAVTGSAPVTQYYDVLGRVIRKLSTGFDGRLIYEDTEYDEQGRVARASLPYYAIRLLDLQTTPAPPEPESEPVFWVETTYDAVNRVVKKSLDTGKTANTSTFSYAGRSTFETNALGQVKETRENVLGKMQRVIEPAGAKVEYVYDHIGNLTTTKQIDTNTNSTVTTSLTYDLRGRKTSMDDPGMGVWSYTYTVFDELKAQTDAKGQVVTMEYDALGRMIERTEAEGITTWEYDTASKGVGKLYKVTQKDSGGTTIYEKTYSYDSLGRPSSVISTFGGHSFTTSTTYDSTGRVDTVSRPNGFDIEHVYNSYGYLLAKRTPSTQIGAVAYDRTALEDAYDDAASSAAAALAAAADYASKAAALETAASHYEALGQAATNPGNDGDPKAIIPVLTELQNTVHNLHEAARVLNDWADTALEVANQLLVVAGHVQDRLYEAELWTDAAGSDADVLQGMKDETNYATWWQATSRDAAGRLSGNRFGNGLQTTRNYDRATGQLLNIRTGVAYDQVLVRDLDYEYDALNNLKYRHNNLEQMQEAFEFDELNRLTKSTVTGEVGGSPYSDVINYGYDALGNMTSKDDVGTGSYLYGNAAKSAGGNAGPHAVRDAGGTAYTYDDNGSMLSGGGRSITWTSYNKPASFEKSGDLVTFDYGPERGRFKKTVGTSSQVDETTLYLGKAYERIETASGGVTHKYFIYAGGHLAAVHIQTEDGQGQVDHSQDKTRYMHHGALGSLDTITAEDGTVEEQLFYSPFGAKRNKYWEPLGGTSLYLETNRGFTGHEHIGEMGLIHMNGRVYDPEIGRFLSADPHVQSPHNSQSYNRYSYVFNNPLKYVDPSGYISFSLSDVFKAPFNAFSDLGKSLARTLAKNEVIRTIGQIAAAFFGPEAAAAYAAFITWGTGGSVGDIFKNAVVAYAGAYAFGEVGDALGLPSNPEFLTSGHITAVSVNGVIGGAMSELGGGNFADGFAGAATAQFLGPFVGEIGGGSSAHKIHRVSVSAVVGGTASALGGGKFANGAVTGAFAYGFGEASRAARSNGPREVAVPGDVKRGVEGTFRDSLGMSVDVDQVRVIEHSRWANFLDKATNVFTFGRYGIRATTQPDTIYLASNTPANQFFSDPELVLHEYYHVFTQWNTGDMSNFSYLLTPGRWETPAYQFGQDNAALYERHRRGP